MHSYVCYASFLWHNIKYKNAHTTCIHKTTMANNTTHTLMYLTTLWLFRNLQPSIYKMHMYMYENTHASKIICILQIHFRSAYLQPASHHHRPHVRVRAFSMHIYVENTQNVCFPYSLLSTYLLYTYCTKAKRNIMNILFKLKYSTHDEGRICFVFF